MTEIRELVERLNAVSTALADDRPYAASVARDASATLTSLSSQVEALKAERTNLIETKREQIARLTAERNDALSHVELLQDKISGPNECACAYDDPSHVCMHHSPQLVAAEARVAVLEEGLRAISHMAGEVSFAAQRARQALDK